jgi:transcriptional regulator with XRE-family HTH domain
VEKTEAVRMLERHEEKVRTVEEQALLRGWGRQVAAWRHEQKLTQEALAEKAGVSPNHIGALERGQTNPSALLLWRVLGALEVEPWEVGFLSPAVQESEHALRSRLGRLAKNCRGKTLMQAVEILAVLTHEAGEDGKGGRKMPTR